MCAFVVCWVLIFSIPSQEIVWPILFWVGRKTLTSNVGLGSSFCLRGPIYRPTVDFSPQLEHRTTAIAGGGGGGGPTISAFASDLWKPLVTLVMDGMSAEPPDQLRPWPVQRSTYCDVWLVISESIANRQHCQRNQINSINYEWLSVSASNWPTVSTVNL